MRYIAYQRRVHVQLDRDFFDVKSEAETTDTELGTGNAIQTFRKAWSKRSINLSIRQVRISAREKRLKWLTKCNSIASRKPIARSRAIQFLTRGSKAQTVATIFHHFHLKWEKVVQVENPPADQYPFNE